MSEAKANPWQRKTRHVCGKGQSVATQEVACLRQRPISGNTRSGVSAEKADQRQRKKWRVRDKGQFAARVACPRQRLFTGNARNGMSEEKADQRQGKGWHVRGDKGRYAVMKAEPRRSGKPSVR